MTRGGKAVPVINLEAIKTQDSIDTISAWL